MKYPDPSGEIGIAESIDDGQTWRWLATIPTRPSDTAASGHLIVHIRNYNPRNAQQTLQSESTNGGKSWSVPHAIVVWCPSHLFALRMAASE